MPTTNEQIHDALMVIDSQLKMVDGKVNLIARANRDPLLKALKEVVIRWPMIGRIYLMLDGIRNQDEVVAELKRTGVGGSSSAVSRYLGEMHTEHGLVERVPSSPGKTYRKNRELEQILNLSKRMEEWLDEIGKTEAAKPGKPAKASSGESS